MGPISDGQVRDRTNLDKIAKVPAKSDRFGLVPGLATTTEAQGIAGATAAGQKAMYRAKALGMVMTGVGAHTKSFRMRDTLTVLPNQIASFLPMIYSGMLGAGDRPFS